MRKIIVTTDVHKSFISNMIASGFVVDFMPDIANEDLRNVIKSYEGLIISSKINVDDVLLSKARNLRFIGRLGSGMENVNEVLAKKMGIKCFNSPEGNRNAVAEHALGMLISLLRNIHVAHQQMRDDLWLREDNRGEELDGKTVGIIGFGNTGQAFAKKLSGFDVKLLVNDLDKKKVEKNRKMQFSSLQQIFEEVDICSIHLPLSETTRHLVNSSFINQFVKQVILINTSRGAILNTDDLIDGLNNKKIGGLALDVFDNEQPKTFTEMDKKRMQFLLNHPSVICSPHIAGWTFEAREKMAMHLYNKISETWN